MRLRLAAACGLLVFLAGCRLPHYVPTVPHLANTWRRHDVALSGSVSLPTDPMAFRFQGQAQYAPVKNLVVMGNAFLQNGGKYTFLGDTGNRSRAHGFDAGVGLQGFLASNWFAGLLGGYSYQKVGMVDADSITRSRFFYRGGWAMAFVRLMVEDYGPPMYYDAGVHMRSFYARHTFYEYYGGHGPGFPYKPDPWMGDRWVLLPTFFAGATLQAGGAEIFTRAQLTPIWAWRGIIGQHFLYSPFGIEMGVVVPFNPTTLGRRSRNGNWDYVEE